MAMSENDIITEMYGDPFGTSGTNVEVILSLSYHRVKRLLRPNK